MHTLYTGLSRYLTLLRFGILLMLASMACNMLTGGPPSNSISTETSSQQVTVHKDIPYGSGSFMLPDARAGLAELSSYKATLTLSFEGTQDGDPKKWLQTFVMHATREPAARQLTIDTTGDASDPGRVFMAEMDGMDYEKRGEDFCSSELIREGNSLSERFEPAGFLNYLVGADEAGSDTVNDTAVSHYTFDQLALGQQDLTESIGEVWVASEGGYVVKYVLTSKGNADFFGDGIEGTITYNYELTDVDQPLEIILPEDCPPGLVDAPTLPDAINVENFAGMLSYDTSVSLQDAMAFYQEKIPALGWQSTGDPSVQDTITFLNYIRDQKSMSIVITTDDTGTQVRILVGSVTEDFPQ